MNGSPHIDDLRAEARYHRERYDLYRAKMYGLRPTTMTRLRELERAHQGDKRASIEPSKAHRRTALTGPCAFRRKFHQHTARLSRARLDVGDGEPEPLDLAWQVELEPA